MRWGVRRYQKYDGTYTKRGEERYKKSEAEYEEQKRKVKELRKKSDLGDSTKKGEYDSAKRSLEKSKKILSSDYNKLKKAVKIDKGKSLASSGKGIIDLAARRNAISAGILIGGPAVANAVVKYGNVSLNQHQANWISAGMIGAAMIVRRYYNSKISDLRAYYNR